MGSTWFQAMLALLMVPFLLIPITIGSYTTVQRNLKILMPLIITLTPKDNSDKRVRLPTSSLGDTSAITHLTYLGNTQSPLTKNKFSTPEPSHLSNANEEFQQIDIGNGQVADCSHAKPIKSSKISLMQNTTNCMQIDAIIPYSPFFSNSISLTTIKDAKATISEQTNN